MTCVAVVVAVAVSLQDIAGAQGQTPSPSLQEQATGEDRTVPPEPPPSTAARNGLRLPFSYVPDVFGHAEVGRRFRITSTDVGTRQFPGDVSGNLLFGTSNPNAPWKVGGSVTYSTDHGTIARIGVNGYRNHRLPLFMSQAIGNGQDVTLPLVSFTDLSHPEMQWEMVAGVEKTLIRTAGGVTIGAVADISIPLAKASAARTVVDTQVPPSITLRGGVKIGF